MSIVERWLSKPNSEKIKVDLYDQYKKEFEDFMHKFRGAVLKTNEELTDYLGGVKHTFAAHKVVNDVREILQTIYHN